VQEQALRDALGGAHGLDASEQEPQLLERDDLRHCGQPTRCVLQSQLVWPLQDSLATLALDLANVKPLFFQFTTGEKKKLSIERTKLL